MVSEKVKNDRTFRGELTEQLLTLATSGFGLAAALAWNEAIQSFVKEFIQNNQYLQEYFPGTALFSKFFYAILITVLAVLITYQLSRLSAHFQHHKH